MAKKKKGFSAFESAKTAPSNTLKLFFGKIFFYFFYTFMKRFLKPFPDFLKEKTHVLKKFSLLVKHLNIVLKKNVFFNLSPKHGGNGEHLQLQRTVVKVSSYFYQMMSLLLLSLVLLSLPSLLLLSQFFF